MHPEIKGFDCVDLDPIEDWVPEDYSDVHYHLCLHIGPAGDIGTEYFYVEVTTPQAINRQNLGSSLRKRCLVINPYSWGAVLDRIQGIVAECKGSDWSQCTRLLCEHFNWEYDGYQTFQE